jgi:hypothetical protein
MDLKMDLHKKNISDEMWANHIKHSYGMCVICSKCGGSSASFCNCAKTKYSESLTLKDIEEYSKTRKPKTIFNDITSDSAK